MRKKYWNKFAVILVVLLTAGYLIFYGYKNAQNAHDQTAEAINNQLTKKQLLTTMYNASQERSVILLRMQSEDDIFQLDDLNMQLGEQARIFLKARSELLALPLSSNEYELIDKQITAAMKNGPLQDSLAQMYLAGESEAATKLLIEEAIPGQYIMRTLLNQSIAEHDKEYAKILDNIEDTFKVNNLISLLLGVLLALSGIAVIIVILTRLTRQEEMAIKTALARAEQADQAKSQFLANMSHEIRTPLNAILGFAQVGQRVSKEQEVRSWFEIIQSSGRHLLGIIDEILDLSKLSAGKLHIDSKPYDLLSCVEGALAIVRDSAQEKGLRLTAEYGEDLPKWVHGDPNRLRQILVNLLGNAIKFTERGEIRLSVQIDDGQLSFAISDDGIGMDDDQLARVFDAFEQADSATARRFGGSGLGLSISRQLVELLGGTITGESQLGLGSTFQFYLPLIVAQKPKDYTLSEVQMPHNRLMGYSVLAVDDDAVNRLVLRSMLKHEGASAVIVENGQQALARLKKDGSAAFDIVIMDVQMPIMDGYEATRQIHLVEPSIPVIGLTAHAMIEEESRCKEAGMVAHLAKPINIDRMVTELLKHLPAKNNNAKLAYR